MLRQVADLSADRVEIDLGRTAGIEGEVIRGDLSSVRQSRTSSWYCGPWDIAFEVMT